MIEIRSIIVSTRVIPVLALMLLASGCRETMHVSKNGDVDDVPLLVRFEMKDQKWCPTEVLQVVESCGALPEDVKPGKDLVCRAKGKKIAWRGVKGASPPFERAVSLPEFRVVFKDAEDVPVRKEFFGSCEGSDGGVLDCMIKYGAESREYRYSVVAGDCVLDPRVYVPK